MMQSTMTIVERIVVSSNASGDQKQRPLIWVHSRCLGRFNCQIDAIARKLQPMSLN